MPLRSKLIKTRMPLFSTAVCKATWSSKSTPQQTYDELLTNNPAQRAHANFTENLTPFLSALLISGLRFPTAAGVIGAGWSVSRMLYLFGYTSSAGPPGREVLVTPLCRLTLI